MNPAMLLLVALLAPGRLGPLAGKPSLPQTRSETPPPPGQRGKRATAPPLAVSHPASSFSLALPFRRAWHYLTESATNVPPSIDDTRIYLPLAGGRIVCLERQGGALVWSTDLGGAITSPIEMGEKVLYVATSNFKATDPREEAALRAVDKETGLTLWVRQFGRRFTSPIELGGARVYMGSSDGGFYALASDSGEVLWRVPTEDVVRGRALATRGAVYFGCDDGNLRAVEPERGQLIWKFQTSGRILGRPAMDGRTIYFGSGDGYMYSVDLQTRKLRWRTRTGAGIEASPVLAPSRLLAVSLDNFVYALSPANGDRIWKRRLQGRIAGDPIVASGTALVAPLRGEYVVVFTCLDGSPVNYFRLEPGFEIIAGPILSGDTLVVYTDKGLVVARSAQAADVDSNTPGN